jgi:hypothetical protein
LTCGQTVEKFELLQKREIEEFFLPDSAHTPKTYDRRNLSS